MTWRLDRMAWGEKAVIALAVLANIVVVFTGDARSNSVMALVNGLIPLILIRIRERRGRIKTIEGFGLQWTPLVLYGALTMYVSIQLSAVMGGVMLAALGIPSVVLFWGQLQNKLPHEFTGSVDYQLADLTKIIVASPEMVQWAATVSLVLLGSPLLYLAGRLMGRRGVSGMTLFGGGSAVCIALAVAFGTSFLTTWLISGSIYFETMSNIWIQGDVAQYLGMFLAVMFIGAITLIPSFVGYWRGRLQVEGAYMVYVLAKLTPEGRDSIFGLAHDEARRLAQAEGS